MFLFKIYSSSPATTVAVGQTITFSCGPQNSCDTISGYNCCLTNNCNCSDARELIANKISILLGLFLSVLVFKILKL